MRRNQARFVTACQQSLALGAVLAVLAPAANVITLDVVGTLPGSPAPAPVRVAPATEGHETAGVLPSDRRKARVETAPVKPEVSEVPMAPAEEEPGKSERHEARSTPQRVTGYGAVGVTWASGEEIEDEDITVQVRTRTGSTWGDWSDVEYHDEHGPDPDSREARDARPGTDPLIVGEVDEVQARAVTRGRALPDDVKLAVIEPGHGARSELEEPAIDTSRLDLAKRDQASDEPEGGGTLETDQGEIALQAGSFTPKPQIFSRAQWGANERMRDAGSLHYYEVHAGFVHHTVNANSYTKSQVPGIIRSIYAYHTQSKGWSDIGYNFLVDRFGRIWEGRYGGVDRPVVGAHTLGYNDYAFAMSAIGNYETARPSAATVDAYGRLMAWKLSLHGIDAGDTSQKVGSRTFQAINGHRDAGSTACPGRYLYARIPDIRKLAAQYQSDWTGRDRDTDVLATGHPDILLRRTSDGAGFVLPTAGMLAWRSSKAVAAGTNWSAYDAVVPSPDLDGDAVSDILVRGRAGSAGVRRGLGGGEYRTTFKTGRAFAGLDQITAVGDLDGDRRNDLVARRPSDGRLFLFRGDGTGGFSRTTLSTAWSAYTLTTGAGDLDGDGRADLLARDKAGVLWLHPGTGRAALAPRTKLAGAWNGYDAITANGDYTGDGRADVFARAASSGLGYVFPGRGNGTFGTSLGPFGAGKGLSHLSGGAQVLGSADPDLVGVRGTSLVVVAHRGTQNVLPLVPVGSAFKAAAVVLNVGDWDRDGHGDVITRPTGSGTLELRRGLPGGKLAPPVSIGSGYAGVSLLTAVGDTTGDGFPDLMGQPRNGSMRIYPGNGAGGFKASYVARGAISASRQLGAGRFDGDGAPDNLIRVNDSLKVLRGNGPGGLTGSASTIAVDLARYDWVLSPGDVTGDKRADLVVREKATGTLWILPGKAGGYAARRFLAEGFAGYDLAG